MRNETKKVKIACRGAEKIPIDTLIEFQGELKSLSAEEYQKAKRGFLELGFSEPISVWMDPSDSQPKILNGHQRLRVLKKMREEGFEIPTDIPVSIVEADSFEQAKRKVLALAQQLGKIEKQGLREFMADANLTVDELEALFRFPEVHMNQFRSEFFDEKKTSEDSEPTKIKPRAQRGDIWILGNHRILCGDSTSKADVAKLMDGKKATLFFTDPPYLVDYTGADRPGEVGKDWSDVFDEKSIVDGEKFFTEVFTCAMEAVEKDAAWYCWHASRRQNLIEKVWDKLGVFVHQQIVWVKPSPVLTYSVWPWQHEPCLVGWRKQATLPGPPPYAEQHEVGSMGWQRGFQPYHNGTRTSEEATSVWFADWEGKKRSTDGIHPTQKPLKLFENAIKKHTVPGDILYEPFSGSGSQIVAAEQLGRHCYAMEIEPTFVDSAIARWEKVTGKVAKKA